jgi:aminoglycoside 6-adenylyltransferase
MDHQQVLAQLVTWATREDGIRALVLTGSGARGPAALHPLSDLDVVVYAADPTTLLDDASWYERFGDVLVVEALEDPEGHPTRLVYYVGGKIDFTIAPALDDATAEGLLRRPIAGARHVEVLVDKDGIGFVAAAPPPGPPEAADLLRCNHWFHAAAIMCAKAIARREPWQAKARDWDAKQQLLQMIEWDHRARHGWTYETWHGGKHLDRWMDEDIRAQLEGCWSGFALDEAELALRRTMDLFEAVSRRTAEQLGVEPFDAGPVREEIATILER